MTSTSLEDPVESIAALQPSPTLPVKVKIWDAPVRITHWLLVLAFIGAYVTHRLGVAYFKYHQWLGYLMIVLVAFRILWGLFGTRHARFGNFIPAPNAAWQYVRAMVRGQARPTVGHNPLGALMVLFLLTTLLIQAATGLFANDEIFNTGVLYSYISNELSLTLTSLHKQLFYWIAYAIGLHILAVLFHTLVKRENLVGAMLTGTKSGHHLSPSHAIESSTSGRALILLSLVSLALYWLVTSAPPTSLDWDL